MKKLVFLLIFGLISVANAESVCEKNKPDTTTIYYLSEMIVEYVLQQNSKKDLEYWEDTLFTHYFKEFKINDKESLCVYLIVPADTSFRKTTLTPQELERYERELVRIGSYQAYKSNKDKWLLVPKFLKYYNKLEDLYSKDATLRRYGYEYLTTFVDGYGVMTSSQFVYGENAGSGVYKYGHFGEELVSLDNIVDWLKSNCKKFERCSEAKSIAQWVEKIKQFKQKGSK